MLWLTPEDPRPIIGLTEAVSSAFPAYLPYEGRFPDVVPHLTVGDTGTPSDLAGVEAAVSPLLPIRAVWQRSAFSKAKEIRRSTDFERSSISLVPWS